MSLVLLIDHRDDDRTRLATLLRAHDFQVQESSEGEAGIAIARRQIPHLVVINAELPDGGGFRICQTLRHDPILQGITLLMRTAGDDHKSVSDSIQAGADDYVTSSASEPLVLARVRLLTKVRQLALNAMLNEQMAQIGQLLTGIVHEIRGPLGVIRGNAELMQMKLSPTDPAVGYTDPIIRAVQILQIRLDHLMAAVRSGRPVLQPTEVGPLVHEAVDYFSKGADLKRDQLQLTLEQEQPPAPTVLADPGRLIQVLLNLMANAREALLIYPEGSRIQVRVRSSRASDHANQVEFGPGAIIEVIDDGPGVPQEMLDRIFQPFFSTKEGGTGFGLYLAAEILREHQGLILASNGPNGGARFTLWLPQAPDQYHPIHSGGQPNISRLAR